LDSFLGDMLNFTTHQDAFYARLFSTFFEFVADLTNQPAGYTE
jgi:hypothetical protein